jgi:hypothetical protein
MDNQPRLTGAWNGRSGPLLLARAVIGPGAGVGGAMVAAGLPRAVADQCRAPHGGMPDDVTGAPGIRPLSCELADIPLYSLDSINQSKPLANRERSTQTAPDKGKNGRSGPAGKINSNRVKALVDFTILLVVEMTRDGAPGGPTDQHPAVA